MTDEDENPGNADAEPVVINLGVRIALGLLVVVLFALLLVTMLRH